MLSYLRFLFIASAALQKASATKQCDILFEKYCKNESIPAANKPFIRVGMDNGEAVPISCFAPSAECDREMRAWHTFFRTSKTIKQLDDIRMIETEERNNWTTKIRPKFYHLAKSLKTTQQTTFETLFTQLSLLNNLNLKAQSVVKHNLGNCAEQSGFAAIKLLEEAQKSSQSFKLQLVALVRTKNKVGPINDHTFLLVNSDAKDILIINNKKQTMQYLEALKKSKNAGDICDSWNMGLLTPFKDDTSNLYDANGSWDSINVRTISFDFKKLNELPAALKTLFCKKLNKMSLSVEPSNACRLKL